MAFAKPVGLDSLVSNRVEVLPRPMAACDARAFADFAAQQEIVNVFLFVFGFAGTARTRIDTSKGEERVPRAWREGAAQAAVSIGRLIQLN
jgi:hypothetical protein